MPNAQTHPGSSYHGEEEESCYEGDNNDREDRHEHGKSVEWEKLSRGTDVLAIGVMGVIWPISPRPDVQHNFAS